MKGLQILLTGTVLLLAAPSAIGANLEGKERAAKRACLVGDVDKGVGILADLYIDTGDATHIFNQGRCFEQNGKNDQAVLRFKEYLRKAKDLSQEDSDAVLKKIDELQGAAGQHGVQPPPAASTVPAAKPIVPAAAVPPSYAAPQSTAGPSTPDPLSISQSGPPPEPQESQPAYKRWWFWTGIGAVVVGGVVTGVLLTKKSTATRPTCDPGFACAP
jgi:hypothetical protein